MNEFKDISGPFSCSGMLPDKLPHIHQRLYTFCINRHRTMTLTYRGCRYDQAKQAKIDQNWWNLAHRPWLCLKYRNVRYFPFVTGGQIK